MGDEHIIPRGFGGTELLRDASCERCERITSQIEEYCIRHQLNPARSHLKLRGRKSKKIVDRALFTGDGLEFQKVPTAAHPGWMIDFTYPYPRLLAGNHPAPGQQAGLINMRPVVPDFQKRVLRLGGKVQITLGGPDSLSMFARLLAKIAHVYAVTQLGLQGFEPWLPPVILQEQPSSSSIMDLVGTALLAAPPTQNLHEVGLDTIQGMHVARIHLFANLPTPSRPHYVVVGRPV